MIQGLYPKSIQGSSQNQQNVSILPKSAIITLYTQSQLSKVPTSRLTSKPSTSLPDPDNQLDQEQKSKFVALHKGFDNVFNPEFREYNGHSGCIKANINIGPVTPF